MNQMAPHQGPKPLVPGGLLIPRAIREAVETFLEPVRRYTAPDGSVMAVPTELGRWTEAQREQAKAAAEVFASDLAPVDGKQLRDWLKVVNAGCRNPQGAEEFAVRATAIAIACDGMPASLFTRETQREALATFQFFPSAHDVIDLIGPRADRMRRELEAVQRLARTPAQPGPKAAAPRPPPTAEEIAAVRAKVASLQPTDETKRPPPGKPLHMSHAQLVATYERLAAEGSHLAKTRLATLKGDQQ